MASIIIPEDVYLKGYTYSTSWVDANEVIGTSNTNVYISLPQKGFGHGVGVFGNPSDASIVHFLSFNNVSAKAFGVGGRTSVTGDTLQYRSRFTQSVLSEANQFGTNIQLIDVYIDDANERLVTTWKSSSGSQTLSARASFRVAKGEVVT